MKARRLWIILLVLAVLTPIGLWVPAHFHAGDAWGEWSLGTIREQTGRVPPGMAREAGRWQAPMADYAPVRRSPSAGYVVSALVGIVVCGGLLWFLGRWLTRREARDAP